MAATGRTSRSERERQIVVATRRLFDERGLQDAPVEQVARAVGINKAIIYRHVASKEELFVLVLADYLAELLERAVPLDDLGDPVGLLRETCARFAAYCSEFPAFPDCALSLMRTPAEELRERLAPGTWLRLGVAMAEALAPIVTILRAGRDGGVFAIEDPDLAANRIYVQVLGTMHLARVGVGVRQAGRGVPELFRIDAADVRRACVEDALRLARGPDAG